MRNGREVRGAGHAPPARSRRPRRRDQLDIRLYRAYAYVLGVLLCGYLFLDRGFSHFHFPKLKVVFLGEMTLLLGVIAVLIGTRWLLRAIRRDALVGVLLAFMGWGALRALANLQNYPYQSVVRDSAIWYYGAFALLFMAAATAIPDLPRTLLRAFRWVVPWLTIWLPLGLIFQRSGIKGPKFRLSGVALLSHRPGNFCCAAVLCLAFLLLIPQGPKQGANGPDRLIVRSYRPWLFALLIVLNLVTVVLGATQTRGGGFAALVAIVLIFLFMDRRRRSRIFMTLLAGTILVVGLGLVTGASYHTTKRTISVSQLFTNAQSVVGSGSGGAQLQGSVNFRTTLWVNVLHAETSSGHFIYGFGFGPNLAQIGGLSQRETNSAAAEQLRSAHNSLLDVLARMGIVGAATFVVFWVGWFVRMIRARRKSKDDDDTRGVIGMCVCFTFATFINCFFDPTLEGAQVAAVLYTLCGLGIICARTPINGIVSPTPRLRPAVPVLGPKLGPSLGL